MVGCHGYAAPGDDDDGDDEAWGWPDEKVEVLSHSRRVRTSTHPSENTQKQTIITVNLIYCI